MDAKQKSYDRMVQEAKHYADADKSDPFSFSRAMAHIKNGIATPDQGYRAEPGSETRRYEFKGETVEYQARIYTNIARP